MKQPTNSSTQAVGKASPLAAANRRARLMVITGAALSFLFSITLWFTGSREEGLFVGLWVPSILSLGALVLPPNRDDSDA